MIFHFIGCFNNGQDSKSPKSGPLTGADANVSPKAARAAFFNEEVTLAQEPVTKPTKSRLARCGDALERCLDKILGTKFEKVDALADFLTYVWCCFWKMLRFY